MFTISSSHLVSLLRTWICSLLSRFPLSLVTWIGFVRTRFLFWHGQHHGLRLGLGLILAFDFGYGFDLHTNTDHLV